MSVRELKEILAARGVDYSQVIEKDELKKLVEETKHLEGKRNRRTAVSYRVGDARRGGTAEDQSIRVSREAGAGAR